VAHRVAAADHSLAAGAHHIRAAGHSRLAAGGGLGSPGVVAQAGKESGRGWDRETGRTGVAGARHSLAAGMYREAGVGMRPRQESVEAQIQDAPKRWACTNLSLRRVRAMRRAILVVRLLRIALALALWGVALAVTLALLSMLRAVIAIVLLAMAAAVVVIARHVRVERWV
jgi:hypothetical protein